MIQVNVHDGVRMPNFQNVPAAAAVTTTMTKIAVLLNSILKPLNLTLLTTKTFNAFENTLVHVHPKGNNIKVTWHVVGFAFLQQSQFNVLQKKTQ